jgi:hypothetical protein
MMLRRILFGSDVNGSSLAIMGLTLLRVFTGIGLITHGFTKLPPSAQFIEGVGKLVFRFQLFLLGPQLLLKQPVERCCWSVYSRGRPLFLFFLQWLQRFWAFISTIRLLVKNWPCFMVFSLWLFC